MASCQTETSHPNQDEASGLDQRHGVHVNPTGDHMKIGQKISSHDVYHINKNDSPNHALSTAIKNTLKVKYQALTVQLLPWMDENKDDLLQDLYVELEMQERDRNGEFFGNGKVPLSQIFTNYKPWSFWNIFRRPVEESPFISSPNLLIEGSAGYGKTTLCKKIAYDWAHGAEYVSHFEYVFLIHLREGECSIDDTMYGLLNFEHHKKEETLREIRQHKTLVILDGYDEVNETMQREVSNIMNCKEMFPEIFTLITSRPGMSMVYETTGNMGSVSQMNSLFRVPFFGKRLTLKGITKTLQETILKRYLADYIPQEQKKLMKRIKQLKIEEEIYECPLFLIMLITLVKENMLGPDEGPMNIYVCFFNFIFQRTFKKVFGKDEKIDLSHWDVSTYQTELNILALKLLKKLGEFARPALDEKKNIFSESELQNYFKGELNIIFQTGIFQLTEKVEKKIVQKYYRPTHLSFLEFPSAYKGYMVFSEIISKIKKKLVAKT